jgi:hypothetical protein
MADKTDDTWSGADFAGHHAWAEMDAFIKQCERDGRAKSDEERLRLQRQFLEIQDRCTARALAIFERAMAGHRAPHLRVVRPEDE